MIIMKSFMKKSINTLGRSARLQAAASAWFLAVCLFLSACAQPSSDRSDTAGSGYDFSGSDTATSESVASGSDRSGTASSASGPVSAVKEKGAGSAADGKASGTGVSSSSIQKRSALIGDRYGIRILCGSDARLSYRDYTASALTAPEQILSTLDVIDRTLGIYPPGFFTSVREGFCDSITICLARDLHAVNDSSHLESAHAFTTVQDDTIWLVLNAEETILPSTLIHELTHVTDYRLLAMHQLLESEWGRLNPQGFSYYNAYLDESGRDLRLSGSRRYTSEEETDPENIWFYDAYSRTYAMEDRARLMEILLEGVPVSGDGPEELPGRDLCFASPHVRTKLRFYFYTLRQAFGTGRWPEQTSWEAALQEAADP